MKLSFSNFGHLIILGISIILILINYCPGIETCLVKHPDFVLTKQIGISLLCSWFFYIIVVKIRDNREARLNKQYTLENIKQINNDANIVIKEIKDIAINKCLVNGNPEKNGLNFIIDEIKFIPSQEELIKLFKYIIPCPVSVSDTPNYPGEYRCIDILNQYFNNHIKYSLELLNNSIFFSKDLQERESLLSIYENNFFKEKVDFYFHYPLNVKHLEIISENFCNYIA